MRVDAYSARSGIGSPRPCSRSAAISALTPTGVRSGRTSLVFQGVSPAIRFRLSGVSEESNVTSNVCANRLKC